MKNISFPGGLTGLKCHLKGYVTTMPKIGIEAFFDSKRFKLTYLMFYRLTRPRRSDFTLHASMLMQSS